MIVHFTTPLNTLEAFFTCSLCLYGSFIEFWFYIYSFQLHLSCHVWFNLFVLCLLDFSFVNLVLDTFLRFYFVCYPLLLCFFLACPSCLFNWVCPFNSITWCCSILPFELFLIFCFVILMWKTVSDLGSSGLKLTNLATL